jgi:hypothetical protein
MRAELFFAFPLTPRIFVRLSDVARARILVCQHDARSPSRHFAVDLFAHDRLVSFFGHKNYRAHKRLKGMWQRGVEKRRKAWVFARGPRKIRTQRGVFASLQRTK